MMRMILGVALLALVAAARTGADVPVQSFA